jgi:long-chain acyl-CoA synthetase
MTPRLPELQADLIRLQGIINRLQAPGSPLAVDTILIDGIETPVFTNVPANLHDVYRLGLANPDLPFLVFEDQRLSFGTSYRRAYRLAIALMRDFHIKPGDRVAICARNSPDWCIAYMAITMTGAIVVPLNAWWLRSEILFGLEDSGSSLIFADAQRIEYLRSLPAPHPAPVIALEPEPVHPHPNIDALLNTTIDAADAIAEFPQIRSDDYASIMYTSGSMGEAKGVLSSHRAIINALYSWRFVKEINDTLHPVSRDKHNSSQPGILANVPLFHVTGCHAQFLFSFLYLRKLVMMHRWDPEQALALIEKERLSVLHGVPTMTWEIMHSPSFDRTDLSSLRSVQSGGAARPPEHLALIQEKFPPQVIPGLGYGLTETNGPGATISGRFYHAKPNSTGRATPPVTAIRIENEAGKVLDKGQVGEVCIKGPTLMKAYWNQPEETARVLKDGWLRSGDLGLLDEDGFLLIKGRIKDIVIRGGENISCCEIESVLLEHPLICEAAAFGLPDERLGERLVAALRLRHDTDLNVGQLQQFLQSRLARFKIPSQFLLQTSQLPRLASGKIDKQQIKASLLKSTQDECQLHL